MLDELHFGVLLIFRPKFFGDVSLSGIQYCFFTFCNIVRDLWSLVLCLFGVQWVMPRRVMDMLDCWKGRFSIHQNDNIWITIQSQSISYQRQFWFGQGNEIFRYRLISMYGFGLLLLKYINIKFKIHIFQKPNILA